MRWTREARFSIIGGVHPYSTGDKRAMRQIDLHKLADDARFNRFHGLVLFWCALIIVFDGYDLAVVGIALPSIMMNGADPPPGRFFWARTNRCTAISRSR